jgi:hypothetical protein
MVLFVKTLTLAMVLTLAIQQCQLAATHHTLVVIKQATLRAVLKRNAIVMMTKIAQITTIATTMAITAPKVLVTAQGLEPLCTHHKTLVDINNNRIKAKISRII